MPELDREGHAPARPRRPVSPASITAPKQDEAGAGFHQRAALALQRTVGNRVAASLLGGRGQAISPLGGRGQAETLTGPPAVGKFAPPPAVAAERTAPLAVQRMTSWYNCDKAGVLTSFGDGLGALAEEAAAEILAKPDAVNAAGGYVDRWHDLYRRHMAGENVTAFIHTSFGYAVEALTCAKVTAGRLALPAGWRVDFQVAAGMTRPDIVVTDDQGAEQGWFDITSSASTGHIFNKAGSQWKTRAYVAEALYPALNLTDLQVSGATAADTVKRRSLARQEIARRKQTLDVLSGHARAVYDRISARSEELTSSAQRRKAFEEQMHEELVQRAGWPSAAAKLAPKAAKSVLAVLDAEQLRCPSKRPWLATMGYTGVQEPGRDAKALARILEHLASGSTQP